MAVDFMTAELQLQLCCFVVDMQFYLHSTIAHFYWHSRKIGQSVHGCHRQYQPLSYAIGINIPDRGQFNRLIQLV